MPRPAVPLPAARALTVCVPAVSVLAVIAAVVSFTRGTWAVGVVWFLLAGLTSNMAWYHARRGRAVTAVCASGGACGTCVVKVCR
ncbi:hypothetical protein [Streptomyces sp. NPDC001435]|uniref:hypothetical protein n=1 Tax=unclassified Streptomyces TaxID=2593676 RepID=UPI00369A5AEA